MCIRPFFTNLVTYYLEMKVTSNIILYYILLLYNHAHICDWILENQPLKYFNIQKVILLHS